MSPSLSVSWDLSQIRHLQWRSVRTVTAHNASLRVTCQEQKSSRHDCVTVPRKSVDWPGQAPPSQTCWGPCPPQDVDPSFVPAWEPKQRLQRAPARLAPLTRASLGSNLANFANFSRGMLGLGRHTVVCCLARTAGVHFAWPVNQVQAVRIIMDGAELSSSTPSSWCTLTLKVGQHANRLGKRPWVSHAWSNSDWGKTRESSPWSGTLITLIVKSSRPSTVANSSWAFWRLLSVSSTSRQRVASSRPADWVSYFARS